MTIRRTVGARGQRPVGPLRAPTPAEYQWSKAMAQFRTKVPKGIFRYPSMAEANADWEHWHVEMVATPVRREPRG